MVLDFGVWCFMMGWMPYEDEYPIPQHEDGRYMSHGQLSWGVIDRESFAGFIGGAGFRLLRRQVMDVLSAHALTDQRVGPGYLVCACYSSMHDEGEHRRHVAEQVVELLAKL